MFGILGGGFLHMVEGELLISIHGKYGRRYGLARYQEECRDILTVRSLSYMI